jgi:IS5 family transposase
MKQHSLGFGMSSKRTRRRAFLDEMDNVVPWQQLVDLVAAHRIYAGRGRPPFPADVMLRIHFMQQWFNLSDPAMEEALHDVPLFREFAGLGGWAQALPDETTILRFRHKLEEKRLTPQILATVNAVLQAKGLMLREGTVVDATLIAAPSSTKNASGERDPEMKQSAKGKQWFFGMKAHVGVDAESGLVHTVRGTAGSVNDVVVANSLLHGEESVVFADAGYQGAEKRPGARKGVKWQIAMRPGKRRQLDPTDAHDQCIEQIEQLKASVRAKVEHAFRVIKRQFGHVKVRYRGLAKNTAQLHTLFALANLWSVRRQLLGAQA